jgi:hypothetical protein
LLLIDETDTFLDLVEKGGTDFLDELLNCLQLQGIRTVITSTYRLYPLASKHPLLAQFERFFIRSFDSEEGKALICKTNVLNKPPPFVRDKQVINEILNKANYSPFYIQKMCEYLYPDKDVTNKQILEKMLALKEFNHFFVSDVSALNNAEKAILCFMVDEEEKDLPAFEILTGAKEIMPRGMESKSIPREENLEVMTKLNILRRKNDSYYLANPVFRRWLNNRCMDNPFRINVEDVEVLTSK